MTRFEVTRTLESIRIDIQVNSGTCTCKERIKLYFSTHINIKNYSTHKVSLDIHTYVQDYIYSSIYRML